MGIFDNQNYGRKKWLSPSMQTVGDMSAEQDKQTGTDKHGLLGARCGESIIRYGAPCSIRTGDACKIREGIQCRPRFGDQCVVRTGNECKTLQGAQCKD